MQKNDLLRKDKTIVRVLAIKEDRVLIIDCVRLTMPVWRTATSIVDYVQCGAQELSKGMVEDVETLKPDERRVAYQRYTVISGVIPYVADDAARGKAIGKAADEYNISPNTVRKYLCLYLAHQNITALAPMENRGEKVLTQDEKNMRWSLNKFFYTKNKNTLRAGRALVYYCLPPKR